MIVGLGANMSELVIEFNKVCIFAFCFTVVWCFLLASIDPGVSYTQSQYVHVDSPSKKTTYYFCYCKNGRKDRVIKRLEVSKSIFDNYYKFHDEDVIHVSKNTIWLRCK